MAEAGPWQDFQQEDTSSGPWEDYAQPQTQPQQVSDSPSLYEALKANIQPFIQHPFRSIYETVVPTPQDIRNIWALTKPETYQQTTQPGSQEWLNQVVGYGIPVATLGAAKFVGGLRGAPEVSAPEAAPAAADVVAPEVRPAAPAPEPAPASDYMATLREPPPAEPVPQPEQAAPTPEAPVTGSGVSEKIAASAWKLPSGEIVNSGPLHGEPPTQNAEAGFLTTKGRFLDRTQAGELATGLKQELRGEDFFQETDVVPSLADHPIARGGDTDTQPAPEAPQVSAIRNESVQQKVAAGQLGEIAPGQGYSTRAMTDAGLQMPPEEVNQHISDLMQGTGDPIKQGMAVRAEAARLEQRATDLSRVAQDNPTDLNAQVVADNAFKDATDFYNGPVARLKQVFHATGMSMQGELPVDLSTYNGQRLAWIKATGEAPPAGAEAAMRKSARNVSRAQTDEQGAMQNLGQAIDRATANRKLPNAEEVRANIRERMGLQPCKV